MKNKQLVWIIVSVWVLSACGGKSTEKGESLPMVRVDTAQICGQGVSQQYPGKVVSSQDANLSFKVAGTIQRLLVKEGEHVRKGQLLAQLDATDYQVQLHATEAEHAQIKAEAERVMGLYKDGGTTVSNYDKARYGLQQIEAKLANHRNQLAYTRIYAPYDGYVQTVYMQQGETTGAGLPVIGMLSSSVPEVEIHLPASAYVNREQFARFLCTFDVLPGQAVEASVVSIWPQANSNQLYTMRLRLQGHNPSITPGMSTWVSISNRGGEVDEVRIPTTSVLEEDGKSHVFVYESKTSLVKRIPVEIVQLHTDGTMEVKGKLHAGDLLVSSGVHHITDGAKVRRMPTPSSCNVGGLM